MHWGARFLGGMHSRGINTLTNPANDPDSKQPELKHAAVRIQAAQLPWRLVAFAFTGPVDSTQPESCPIPALALIDQLAVWMREMPFASAVPIGRDREGVLIRLAAEQPPAQGWLGSLDTLLGLGYDGVARYDDLRLGVARRVDIRDGRLHGVRLSGPAKTLQGEAWLLECLLSERPVASIRNHLLAPNARPPEDLKPRSPIVCSCFDVDERRIREALHTQHRKTPDQTALSSLESTLRCGTNCGSCRPRLKQLIAECLS
jgi:assimilatory nitrate reductase catalytic subunit